MQKIIIFCLQLNDIQKHLYNIHIQNIIEMVRIGSNSGAYKQLLFTQIKQSNTLPLTYKYKKYKTIFRTLGVYNHLICPHPFTAI